MYQTGMCVCGVHHNICLVYVYTYITWCVSCTFVHVTHLILHDFLHDILAYFVYMYIASILHEVYLCMHQIHCYNCISFLCFQVPHHQIPHHPHCTVSGIIHVLLVLPVSHSIMYQTGTCVCAVHHNVHVTMLTCSVLTPTTVTLCIPT